MMSVTLNEPDSEDKSDSKESTSGDLNLSLESATGHADMGLPDSSLLDDTDEDPADANEGGWG